MGAGAAKCPLLRAPLGVAARGHSTGRVPRPWPHFNCSLRGWAWETLLARPRAWAAGLYEGEGCAYTERVGKGRRLQHRVCVQVKMTDRDVLEQLMQHWGGAIQSLPIVPNRKPIWRWRIKGGRARHFLVQIRPLLGQRRRAQIMAIL